MELREQIANTLYGELHDGSEDVHPYDERWYKAADAILDLPEIKEALKAKTELDALKLALLQRQNPPAHA
jgi:hypothetical protein